MNWTRQEHAWLIETLDGYSARGAPWPRGAALMWLRYAYLQARVGKKIWTPEGSIHRIPGRPRLARIWGAKRDSADKAGWTDHRVKMLLAAKQTITVRFGPDDGPLSHLPDREVEVTSWWDPYFAERDVKEELQARHRKAQEAAKSEKAAKEDALKEAQDKIAQLKRELEALTGTKTTSPPPALHQGIARDCGASGGNHDGAHQESATESPERLHGRGVDKTLHPDPLSPPKAPQGSSVPATHPPAPAQWAGEPDPERAAVQLSDIPGASGRTVQALAEAGIRTVDDLDRVYPAMPNRPKRPGPKALEALRVALGTAGYHSRLPEWRDRARDLRTEARRAQDPQERQELLGQAAELFRLVCQTCQVDRARGAQLHSFQAELQEVLSQREALAQGTPEQRAEQLLAETPVGELPWSYEAGTLGRDFHPWGRDLSPAQEETHRALWLMGGEVRRALEAERAAAAKVQDPGPPSRPAADTDDDCDDSPGGPGERDPAPTGPRLLLTPQTRLADLMQTGELKHVYGRQVIAQGVQNVAQWRERGASVTFHSDRARDEVVRVLGEPGVLDSDCDDNPRGPFDLIASVIGDLRDAYEDGTEAEFPDPERRRIAQEVVRSVGGPQGLARINSDAKANELARTLVERLFPGQGVRHAV